MTQEGMVIDVWSELIIYIYGIYSYQYWQSYNIWESYQICVH